MCVAGVNVDGQAYLSVLDLQAVLSSTTTVVAKKTKVMIPSPLSEDVTVPIILVPCQMCFSQDGRLIVCISPATGTDQFVIDVWLWDASRLASRTRISTSANASICSISFSPSQSGILYVSGHSVIRCFQFTSALSAAVDLVSVPSLLSPLVLVNFNYRDTNVRFNLVLRASSRFTAGSTAPVYLLQRKAIFSFLIAANI